MDKFGNLLVFTLGMVVTERYYMFLNFYSLIQLLDQGQHECLPFLKIHRARCKGKCDFLYVHYMLQTFTYKEKHTL